MKAKELITMLQAVNPDARVFMGYDGNIVVTEPHSVEEIATENDIGNCWRSVRVGDVVIICDDYATEPIVVESAEHFKALTGKEYSAADTVKFEYGGPVPEDQADGKF